MASNVSWINVDVTTLTGETATEYKAMQAAKAAFEQSMIADARNGGMLQPSDTLRFGYQYGKLSVAVVPLAAGNEPKSWAAMLRR